MNTLAGNVRNITKQKENANAEIQSLKNRLVNQNLTIKQRNVLQNLVEKKRKEKNELANKLKELEKDRNLVEAIHKKLLKGKQKEILKISAERESLRAKAALAARERNNLKAESNERQQALKVAAEKEAEITKKLGERNASIKNLTEQRAKLLEKGELNATEKAELERIRKELTGERNAKNNEISRLQTLYENREKALKEISTKLNEATRSLARSEGLISTQKKSLEAKNKNLKARQNQVGNLYSQIETLTTQATQANEEIKQQTTKLATSASEINRLQKQLNNATEARTRNINNMQMRHAENIRAATAQIQELTKNVQERNAIIQRSKVTGQWKGAAVRGLGTQLKNTRTNLTRAQKEIGVARTAVNGLRGQRNTLSSKLALAEQQALEATTLTQRQAQQQLNQSRRNQMQTMRALEKARLAKNRASNRYNTQNFNATAAFQQMSNRLTTNKNAWKRGVRGRWQNVARPGAAYLKNEENLRVAKNTLRALINSKRPNGNYTIGGLFGQKRRQLKSELERVFNMTQLREIRKKIAAAKNIKNTEVTQKRMNKTLSMAGSSTNNFKFGNRTQPIVNRGELLKQNNRNI